VDGKLTAREAGEKMQKANSFAQRFRRLFQRCVKLGLIEEEKAGEKIVPYTTRHSRITELFIEGNDHAVVMFDAGHVVPATTERYKQLSASHVADAIRRRDTSGAGESSPGTPSTGGA
jgi:site-specific recombinase XerD